MAGSCPVDLAAAAANAGAMGGMGALLSSPEGIAEWAAEFRSQSKGPFQLNLWIPGPAPARDLAAEKLVREFLATWGPAVLAEAANVAPGEFGKQCEAFLAAEPAVVSSIMGVYPRVRDKVKRAQNRVVRMRDNACGGARGGARRG
jgi:nitronate monooxygenase